MISIIILNFNAPDDTLECIDSLMRDKHDDLEVLLIDNGSTDNSVEFLRCLESKYRNLKFIQNANNLGFADGNNVGITKATGDYILLLNNDTIVKENFITQLAKQICAHPDAGIIGLKIYYYYEPKKIWFAGGKLDWLLGGKHIGIDEIDIGQYDVEKEVDFVTGCAMLIKREVLERIGYLDSSFLFYYEDVDFCIRARNAGYKCIYLPSPIVWHKVGASVNREKKKINQLQLYLGTRNKINSVRKNCSTLKYTWFLIKKLIIFSPIYFFVLIFRRDYDLLYAYAYGLLDGLQKVTPKRFIKL